MAKNQTNTDAISTLNRYKRQSLENFNRVSTVETLIKEPIIIGTLRLKFNILNPLNKNLLEADTGGGSYITGFMSSEFIRTFKNS